MAHKTPASDRLVLIADDNKEVREVLTHTLRTRFSDTHAVSNGRQLLKTALERTPDVIVSDVSMPILGGIAAMLALQDLGCDVPFVMVSADPEWAAECLRLGAAAFVSKFDLAQELIPAVLAALAGRTYLSSSAAAATPATHA